MSYSLVMLWMGGISLLGNKCKCRGNIRASAVRMPIDYDNNTMIDLFFTRKISIEGFTGRNVFDGEPGTIRGHVGNLVGSAN